nr:hypothetical protein [Tanacetum cinerariifolium]
MLDVVINDGQPQNFVSRDVVQHLKIFIGTITYPYTIRWGNSTSEFLVTEFYKIPFAIGKYKDGMLFDVYDMDACHIILGKPWVYDLNAIYNIEDNTYKFQHMMVGHNIKEENIVQNMEVIHGVKKQNVEFGSEEDKEFCYKHCWVKNFEVGDLVMEICETSFQSGLITS